MLKACRRNKAQPDATLSSICHVQRCLLVTSARHQKPPSGGHAVPLHATYTHTQTQTGTHLVWHFLGAVCAASKCNQQLTKLHPIAPATAVSSEYFLLKDNKLEPWTRSTLFIYSFGMFFGQREGRKGFYERFFVFRVDFSSCKWKRY